MKKAKGFLNEFKSFAMRGNVIDLAIGVIIGGAFQKIVNSLVNDVIMPVIGFILGDIDFSNLFLILGKIPENANKAKLSSLSYVRDELGVAIFAYGSFITNLINFLLMALVIFFLVKFINKISNLTEKEQPETEPQVKTCDFCKTEIPAAAVKCPQCTSDLNKEN